MWNAELFLILLIAIIKQESTMMFNGQPFNSSDQINQKDQQSNTNLEPINFHQSQAQFQPPSYSYANNDIGLAQVNVKQIPSAPPVAPIDILLQDNLESRSRLSFVFKVFSIVAMQFALTIGICCLSYFVSDFLNFQVTYWWVAIILWVVVIVISVMIWCWQGAKRYPLNLILLLIFTLCVSYNVSMLSSLYAYYYGGALVISAAIITFVMLIALSVYACFVPENFSKPIAIVVLVLACFATFGVLAVWPEWNPLLYNLYCCLGVVLCGVFIVFDIEWILGSDRRMSLSRDDYVIGAMVLYIDIIRLFICLLRLLGAGRS